MPEASDLPVPHARSERVVIVLVADLAAGPAANIAACLASGLAASAPGWAGRALLEGAGLRTVASSHLPIAVLRAKPEAMQALIQKLVAAQGCPGGTVSLFPHYAQAVHDAHAYWQRHAEAVHAEEPLLGLGLHGPRRWVSQLTGSLPLWC